MYRVKKVLNNNALLVIKIKKDQEVIFLATGIGYNQRPEAEIEIHEAAAAKYVLFEEERQNQSEQSCFPEIETWKKKDQGVPSLWEWLENRVHCLEKDWSPQIDLNSFSYSRLLVHLCYLLARQNQAVSGQPDINGYAKRVFPLAYALSLEILASLQENWGITVHETAIGILALHIERILQARPEESV